MASASGRAFKTRNKKGRDSDHVERGRNRNLQLFGISNVVVSRRPSEPICCWLGHCNFTFAALRRRRRRRSLFFPASAKAVCLQGCAAEPENLPEDLNSKARHSPNTSISCLFNFFPTRLCIAL